MMDKKILFITDSLGLPREKPEVVPYPDTYVNLLKAQYPNSHIIQLSIGGAVLPYLYAQAKGYYAAYKPDLVVVQSGIVDCAPRTLLKMELEFIIGNRFLKRIWNKFFKPYSSRIRDFRKVSYTNKEIFGRYVSDMLELFGEENVLWIPIMPASDAYELRVPGIKGNIEKYNRILKNNLKENLLDTNADCSWLMSDFHHLNSKGHKQVSRVISDRIDSRWI